MSEFEMKLLEQLANINKELHYIRRIMESQETTKKYNPNTMLGKPPTR